MILLNDKPINVTIFPDKTSQVWKLENIKDENNVVKWYFENEAEVMHLQQLSDLLDELLPDTSDIVLFIPFMPYARQDKNICNEETFALSSILRILNEQCWSLIVTFDIHSDKYLKSYRTINRKPSLNFTLGYDAIIFPDQGAKDRYQHYVATNRPKIAANKVRDRSTGYITHYECDLSSLNQNSRVVVVDDLCDGGMTFEILGRSLHEKGITNVDLYVSHGIFSKGLDNLKKYYNKIFASDSILNQPEGVTIIPMEINI